VQRHQASIWLKVDGEGQAVAQDHGDHISNLWIDNERRNAISKVRNRENSCQVDTPEQTSDRQPHERMEGHGVQMRGCDACMVAQVMTRLLLV
jgi:hypothetical protein